MECFDVFGVSLRFTQNSFVVARVSTLTQRCRPHTCKHTCTSCVRSIVKSLFFCFFKYFERLIVCTYLLALYLSAYGRRYVCVCRFFRSSCSAHNARCVCFFYFFYDPKRFSLWIARTGSLDVNDDNESNDGMSREIKCIDYEFVCIFFLSCFFFFHSAGFWKV